MDTFCSVDLGYSFSGRNSIPAKTSNLPQTSPPPQRKPRQSLTRALSLTPPIPHPASRKPSQLQQITEKNLLRDSLSLLSHHIHFFPSFSALLPTPQVFALPSGIANIS